MCCPASSATIVAPVGPFLGASAVLGKPGVSPCLDAHHCSPFPKAQPPPEITRHHDIGPFFGRNRTIHLVEAFQGTVAKQPLSFPDFRFLSGPARTRDVLSARAEHRAGKEPLGTPFLPLSRHSSGGDFCVSARMQSWVPYQRELVGVQTSNLGLGHEQTHWLNRMWLHVDRVFCIGP